MDDIMKNNKMSWEYIAGFFDGEGTVGVFKTSFKYMSKKLNRSITYHYQKPVIAIYQKTNNDKVLYSISKFLLKHKITTYICEVKPQSMTYLRIGNHVCIKKFLVYTLPYLYVKKDKSLEVINFIDNKKWMNRKY